jgi:hypothetical protein
MTTPLMFSSSLKTQSSISNLFYSQQLGFFLLTQVPFASSNSGLVLAWHPGIDFECFITNKKNISAWCFFGSPKLS